MKPKVPVLYGVIVEQFKIKVSADFRLDYRTF